MKIGVKVTLRGDKIVRIHRPPLQLRSAPRPRLQGHKPRRVRRPRNYSLGLKEQLIFPEIEYDKVDKIRGMDIAFVTTAETDAEARELLALMGAPFAK